MRLYINRLLVENICWIKLPNYTILFHNYHPHLIWRNLCVLHFFWDFKAREKTMLLQSHQLDMFYLFSKNLVLMVSNLLYTTNLWYSARQRWSLSQWSYLISATCRLPPLCHVNSFWHWICCKFCVSIYIMSLRCSSLSC